jgi:flagellar protein FlbD
MIELTRLNDTKLTVNFDLMEFIEETPDTIITFSTGTKLVVREKTNEIKDKIIEYKRNIFIM